MAIDHTRPLKLENPASGGVQTDSGPTEVTISADYLDCAGVALQDQGVSTDVADAVVIVDRVTGTNQLRLTDTSGAQTLGNLVTAATGFTASHQTIQHLIHFLSEGPGDGYASGAYKTVTPAGSPFPTAVTWYTSNGMGAKIVQKNITYSGAWPTQIQWQLYGSNGTTVVHTVTDVIAYSGAFESTRTRTIV